MKKSELGRILTKSALIKGAFKTRSGAMVEQYFDKYLFENNPRILALVAAQLANLIDDEKCSLAGMEMGGIPIATAMSLVTYRPLYLVRKRAKQHGTENIVEGGSITNVPLVIVEDIVTRGGAAIDAITHIRELGGIVSQVICVLDREEGGKEAVEKLGVDMCALFRKSELF